MKRTVTLNVDTDDDQAFVEIYERLAQQAAGLILDGIDARVYSYLADEEPAS